MSSKHICRMSLRPIKMLTCPGVPLSLHRSKRSLKVRAGRGKGRWPFLTKGEGLVMCFQWAELKRGFERVKGKAWREASRADFTTHLKRVTSSS